MNILKTISLIIIATSLLFSLASEDLKDMLFDNVSFEISKNDFLSKIDKNKTDIENDGGNIIVLRLKDKKCNLLSSIRFLNVRLTLSGLKKRNMKIEILEKFCNKTDYIKLLGGQETSIKIENIVIKPIENTEKYKWVANSISEIEFENILVSKFVKSKNDNWVEDGHVATIFIEGDFFENRINEKIKASIEFHRKTARIEKPENFDKWESPWSLSSKVAWQELSLPNDVNSNSAKIIMNIMDQYKPISLSSQFIHSDLAGNIFFNKNNEPIIIDISPEFRPVEYANTMLITDSIAWHNGSVNSLNELPYPLELKIQLILRAVVFRLCVPIFFDKNNYESLNNEFMNFKPILNTYDIET